jgi:hypothetical protein
VWKESKIYLERPNTEHYNNGIVVMNGKKKDSMANVLGSTGTTHSLFLSFCKANLDLYLSRRILGRHRVEM